MTPRLTHLDRHQRLHRHQLPARLTSYGYDELGRTVVITDALDHPTVTVYDGRGQRRFVTNAANETTEFRYDGAGRLTEVIDNLQHVTHYTYNKGGERTALLDADSVETRYGYDPALGRLITKICGLEAPAFRRGEEKPRFV